MARSRHSLPTCTRCLPLLFLLFGMPSFASPIITLSPDFTRVTLGGYTDLLADPNAEYTVAQIASEPIANNFAPASRATAQHSAQRGVYWLRFGIHNPLPQTQIIVLNLSVPDDITISAFDRALQKLPLQRTPLLELSLPPQSKQLFYLRVDSSRGPIETAQLELLSLNRYLIVYRIHSWLGGAMQSGLILLAIAAAFTGAMRRDSVYGWLAGYCITLMIFQLLYRADFNPLSFRFLHDWHYKHQFLQACVLFSNICSIRIAQRLPISKSYKLQIMQPLMLLLLMTAIFIPMVFFVSPFSTGSLLIIILSLATQITTIILALYNFLSSHRRELLFYGLVRTFIFALTIGGAFAWHINSAMRVITDNLVPVAQVAEAMGLFAILLWRSFELQREQAFNQREIAVLEAEGRSRTEVVAEVGHRIRTPISGVLGMLDMLQDTALSATQTDYLNTIRRASNELLNAIDEMSDVTHLQTHAATLQQNIFDPHVLITECVDGFRSAATARYLELINDLAPELPAYVIGDLTRVRQIVLQLLHQAVSQHERGEILLRVRQLPRDRLRFDMQTRARFAAIPPSDIDRRINPRSSANVRFAIAQQLIEMLGGNMQIDDLADGNLLASFDLPLPAVEGDDTSAVKDTALQGKRLLVIDDNATFCDVLERQLSHWGMTVYTAHSASEGLARLRNQITLSEAVDVLLVDIDMPDLDYSDWQQRLLNEIKPPPILIFLSSGFSKLDTQVLDSRRLLLKPINHTSLKITLIEAFKQRQQRLSPPPRKRDQPIRCLFAEDNLINAKVLAGMLDKLGVAYTAVSNGQEAVDACRREEFDVVLMDWDMPVMDGWEASRCIREMYESRNLPSVPIIALTANTVEELGERARQLVMDAHLVKPIRLQDLRELLEQWTGKTLR